MGTNAGNLAQSIYCTHELEAANGLAPESAEQGGVANGLGQEAQVVDFDKGVELARGIKARGGGAVAVFDLGSGAEDGWPAVFPGGETEVHIFHVGGFVDFAHAAEGEEFGSIEEGTAAAAIEHPGEIFAGERNVAADGEIQRIFFAPDGFACFFTADAGGEEDLGGGAEELGDLIESGGERGDEAGLDDHVVIDEQNAVETGDLDSGVYGFGERERGGGFNHADGRMGCREPGCGAIG